jgi:1-acyl-sn-glycerol-3-phosphate acyltransferase
MRSALVLLAMLVLTPPLAALVVLATAFGVADRPGSVLWWAPRAWGRGLLRAAGVRVRVHGADRMGDGQTPRVFVSNHVSWFDVFALAATLPRYSFVSKAEILRIPVFGPAARALGTISIERHNRKSAFLSYDEAARQVRAGRPVIVFPEGTRGRSYPLRPFKKGPFVLAIAAAAPIVPTLIHGTIPILPKGSWHVRGGTIDVHFLEPVSTEGLNYDDRDALMRRVRDSMSDALAREYGVDADSRHSSTPLINA